MDKHIINTINTMEDLEKLLSKLHISDLMTHLDDCGFPKDQNWNKESTTWYLDDIEIKIQGTDLIVTKNK